MAFVFFSDAPFRNATNVWEHRKQSENATRGGVVSRRSTLVTVTPARIFHSVFIVKQICPRVQNLLRHGRNPLEIHSTISPVCRSSHDVTPKTDTVRRDTSTVPSQQVRVCAWSNSIQRTRTEPDVSRVPASIAFILFGARISSSTVKRFLSCAQHIEVVVTSRVRSVAGAQVN